MNQFSSEPSRALRTRHRSSTQDSTGLDYSSVLHIEEDISSRIRNLLLSRHHHHHPPRTPPPSEEDLVEQRKQSNIYSVFDFSSAKSVAKQARLERIQSGRLSLPVNSAPVASSGASRNPSLPNSLSFDSVIEKQNDNGLCDISSIVREGERLEIPGLVLVDIVEPNQPAIRSCIAMSSNCQARKDNTDPCDMFADLAEGKELLFPRLALVDEPKPGQPIIRSYLPELMSEISSNEHSKGESIAARFKHDRELAGFCDSCPSGCDKEQSISALPGLTLKPKKRNKLRRETEVLAFDGPRTLTDGTMDASQTSGEGTRHRSLTLISPTPTGLSNDYQADMTREPPRSSVHSDGISSDRAKSSRRISKEIAEIIAQSISATAVGSNLTESESKVRRLSDESTRVLADQVHSKKTKLYNPSLLSGTSRSSVRHSLLKSSAVSQVVDNGLPVPPLLTPVDVAPPTLSSQSLSKNIHEPSGAQSLKSLASTPRHEQEEISWATLPISISPEDDLSNPLVLAKLDDRKESISPLQSGVRGLVDTSTTLKGSLSKASLWNEPPASPRGTDSTTNSFSSPEFRGNGGDRRTLYPSASSARTDDRRGRSLRYAENFEIVPLNSDQEENSHSQSEMIETNWPIQRIVSTEIAPTPSQDASLRSHTKIPVDDSTSSPQDRVGKKHIQWFKDLIIGKDANLPYQSQLTEMPKRNRQSPEELEVRQRAMTSPAAGVDDLFPKISPRATAYIPKGPKRSITSAASQTFTKTIIDLEHLLNEALGIARLAVDNEAAPSILGTATELLKGRRERSSRESVHESLRSFSSIGSDDSEHSVESSLLMSPEDKKVVLQSIAADTIPGQDPSGWPPTGRGATPFPPQSARQSVVPDAKPDLEYKARHDTTSRAEAPRKSIVTSIPERQNLSTEVNTATSQNKITRELSIQREDPTLGYAATTENVQGKQIVTARRATTENSASSGIGSSVSRTKQIQSKQEVHEYIKKMHEPPLQPRASSRKIRQQPIKSIEASTYMGVASAVDFIQAHTGMTPSSSIRSLDGPLDSEIDFNDAPKIELLSKAEASERHDDVELRELSDKSLPKRHLSGKRMDDYHHLFNLKGRSHVSLKNNKGFSLSRTHRRQPIARDWPPFRKRFVATVACISTALLGILIGIYAGEVPAIQYYIADFHHYTILGNVFFFIGLSVPTIYFWPLPLMHGRKPYTLAAMTIAMPLLFPQAIAVANFRSPFVRYWRIGLLLPRGFMGFALGFANMNFKSTLMDLFGASLQSSNPHAEVVDETDVRRHGGGMGIWLGIWTWCSIGSIGVGFMAGASIIEALNPAWGFYISIIIIAAVLLLNVVCPEVRRSAFRRSVVEVKTDDNVSRRLARGEIMMHRKSTGPKWWGEEVHHGMLLSQNMLRQPGFLVMAIYVAWIYAQIVLIIVLLGSLMSRDYSFKSPHVGASVMAVPIGVFLSIPFSKASIFSRARHHSPKTNTATIGDRVHMSSHVIRRSVFSLILPFAGIAYTVSSNGPPTPFMIPIIFAGLIGFLSGLAISECHGLIMETYDTSDLHPGMSGRSRAKSGDKSDYKRTNYSSFPRVSSAFAITQGLGFLLAAGSTGVGGVVRRHLGQQSATGVMAGILLLLTFLLLGVLLRFKEVQIIPDSRKEHMERWKDARRASMLRKENPDAVPEEEPWRPLILGNPSGTTRRMSVLELGGMSRWSEIRKKNRLIDEQSLEAKHPNLAVLDVVRAVVSEQQEQVTERVSKEMERIIDRVSPSRSGSRRSNRRLSDAGDLGGNVQVVKSWRKVETVEPVSGGSTRGRGSRRRVSEVREERIV
ncbi:hypothetical protein PVAG01_04707 [Phlyctema vagabunda]|uniref:MFS general substrate transporter n=1 Tax=Phlyctema vagabunda TaxID=108571 RepID=A0ABR4PI40_9HELO